MGIYSEHFRPDSYWWDKSPRPAIGPETVPAQVDVAVIGSGYTGLNAAIEIARGGRSVCVVDAEAAGWGCSSRNGGQVSASIKEEYGPLKAAYGEKSACAILDEGNKALAWIGDWVAKEKLDCDYKVTGRFHAAHNPRAYDKLAKTIVEPPKSVRQSAYMVPLSDQDAEIGTRAYFGGAVFEKHAALDPGRYHLELLRLAQQAGVEVVSHARVNGIARENPGFQLDTGKGRLKARDIVLATNGYTGSLTPWQQRRVIPIGSYIIATEPLEPELMDRLLPTDRMISDSRRIIYYYRRSPDQKRIVFGGRVSMNETDPLKSAPLLRRDLIALFPQLSDVKISHSWLGFVAYTFDTMPHIGCHEGIYYAMGYCGSGISLSSYLGMRIGQKLLGLKEAGTAFDEIPFQTRPFYTGNPWFLGASVAFFRMRDRMGF